MKTILVVQDDVNLAQALRLTLESAGFRVLTTDDRNAALNMARVTRPHLAFLDANAARGPEPTVAARMKENCPALSLVLLAKDDNGELDDVAKNCGAMHVLREPYQFEEVLDVAKRAAASEPQGSPAVSAAAKETSAGGVTSPKRLLIIEDDLKIARALGLRVKAAGYEVAMAHDALTGLDKAIKWRPDLVLLDVSMPGGNGFTVAERIQTLVPTLTPIIFLTASKRTDFRERADELGAVGYFEKPYRPEELLHAIHEAVCPA